MRWGRCLLDASAISTTTQNQAMTSAITSPQASIIASSKAIVPSSDNRNVSSGSLELSDIITIGIDVLIGVATVLATELVTQQKKIIKIKTR